MGYDFYFKAEPASPLKELGGYSPHKLKKRHSFSPSLFVFGIGLRATTQ
jgi:hypothetical protein